MSVQATTWAAAQTCGSAVSKLVLLTLADWADQEGVWLLNVSRLAAHCEAEASEMETALSDLSARGHLWIAGAVVQMTFQSVSENDVEALRAKRTPSWRIAQSRRFAIYARDGHACVYCGSDQNLTLDHVVPRSKGGSDVEPNLVTACQPCNASKGNRDLKDWKGRE